MTRKLALAAIVFVAALVALPAIAGAHVEIAPESKLSADGTITATLTVPNECVKSETTSLDLNFPTTPVVTKLTVAPVVGWTSKVDQVTATGAVTKMTLVGSLTGADEKTFALTFAGVPAGTDSIKFTALQNCANGDVIRWVEPTPVGGAEPEFPAPVLDVAQSGAQDGTTSTTKVAVTTTTKKSDSNTGVIIGIVAASVVLIGAGVVLFKRNSTKK
jgi:Domain of unkown function (DUF1775).